VSCHSAIVTRSRHKNLRRFLATLSVIFDNWYKFIFERVKAAEIADRKLIRIGLIWINLRSPSVDDLSELSRS
jgi:hypothetical protein